MRSSWDSQLEWLRCPVSGERLFIDEQGSLRAESGRQYPVVAGIPILIAPELSLFDTDGYLEYSPKRSGTLPTVKDRLSRGFRALLHHPPTISLNVRAAENFGRLAALLQKRAQKLDRLPRVLVVGGQVMGEGAATLLDSARFDVVETDIAAGPRTAIVCDAHNLPFADGSFDAVVCQAVLEHVIDPNRVAAEVHRVLGDQGLVYSEIPFMQQVHEGAFDFTRFTHLGHLRLWHQFDEIQSGATGGPGMVLLWSIRYFLQAFLGRSRVMRALCLRLVSLTLFWVKYLDPWLVRKPGGIDGASGTFFLGQRRSSSLPDRTVMKRYRGLGPFA